MLTDAEREVFSKLLDANFEASQNVLDEDLQSDVKNLKRELCKLMGESRYWEFMCKGRQMFA